MEVLFGGCEVSDYFYRSENAENGSNKTGQRTVPGRAQVIVSQPRAVHGLSGMMQNSGKTLNGRAAAILPYAFVY